MKMKTLEQGIAVKAEIDALQAFRNRLAGSVESDGSAQTFAVLHELAAFDASCAAGGEVAAATVKTLDKRLAELNKRLADL